MVKIDLDKCIKSILNKTFKDFFINIHSNKLDKSLEKIEEI